MNKSTTFRGEPDPYRPQPKKQPHHAPTPAAAPASASAPAPAPETRPAAAAVVHEPGKLYEGDVPVHTEPPAQS